MKKDKFIKELMEILEIKDERLKEDTDFKTLEEYDSLAAMSIIAFIDENFDKQLKAGQLKNVATIKNLMELIGLEYFEV